MNRKSGIRIPTSVICVPARFDRVSITSEVVTNVKMIASNTHQKNVIVTAIHGTPGLSTLLPTLRIIRSGRNTNSCNIAHRPATIICTAPRSETTSWSRKRNTPPQ